MKLTVLTVVTAAFALIMIAHPAFPVEVDIGPKNILMKSPEAKKPAEFPHRDHQKSITCTACHHTDDKVMDIQKCVMCHNDKMSNQDLNDLKKAGHALCKECHKKSRQEGKDDASGRCSTCHPLEIRNNNAE